MTAAIIRQTNGIKWPTGPGPYPPWPPWPSPPWASLPWALPVPSLGPGPSPPWALPQPSLGPGLSLNRTYLKPSQDPWTLARNVAPYYSSFCVNESLPTDAFCLRDSQVFSNRHCVATSTFCKLPSLARRSEARGQRPNGQNDK